MRGIVRRMFEFVKDHGVTSSKIESRFSPATSALPFTLLSFLPLVRRPQRVDRDFQYRSNNKRNESLRLPGNFVLYFFFIIDFFNVLRDIRWPTLHRAVPSRFFSPLSWWAIQEKSRELAKVQRAIVAFTFQCNKFSNVNYTAWNIKLRTLLPQLTNNNLLPLLIFNVRTKYCSHGTSSPT